MSTTVSVYNNDAVFTISGASTLAAADTLTVDVSGRWHYGVGVTANAVGDYPSPGGYPQFIAPLNVIPTFGLVIVLVPHGTPPPTITGTGGVPQLSSLLQGVLAVSTAVGTDHYANSFGPAQIAASNPPAAALYDVYYRIADNTLTDNSPREPLTVTTSVCAVPRQVSVLAAAQACIPQPLDQEIDLSWTAAGDATAYEIYIDSVLVDTVDASVLTYAHRGVQVGETYDYSVRPINVCGVGVYSNMVSVTVRGWVRDCGGPLVTMAREAIPASTMTRNCGGCP